MMLNDPQGVCDLAAQLIFNVISICRIDSGSINLHVGVRHQLSNDLYSLSVAVLVFYVLSGSFFLSLCLYRSVPQPG